MRRPHVFGIAPPHWLWAILLIGGVACEQHSPGAPSPGQPRVQSVAVSGTLALFEPGDTGQLTATATFADGTTRDVTGEASWHWSGSRPAAVVSSTGLVTALAYGAGDVVVTYGSGQRALPVRVAPQGSSLLAGTVTGGDRRLNQARVEAASAAGTFSTLTDSSGAFVLPGASLIALHVSKFGYEVAERHVTIGRDDTIAIDLAPRAEPDPILGEYTLTFIASPSCEFPAEARRRTYRARIERDLAQHPFSQDLLVALGGANLVFDQWWGAPGFPGMVDGGTVTFEVSDNVEGYAFVERVQDMTIAYSGRATGTASDRSIVTLFDGTVSIRSGSTTVALCTSTAHRLEFTR